MLIIFPLLLQVQISGCNLSEKAVSSVMYFAPDCLERSYDNPIFYQEIASFLPKEIRLEIENNKMAKSIGWTLY